MASVAVIEEEKYDVFGGLNEASIGAFKCGWKCESWWPYVSRYCRESVVALIFPVFCSVFGCINQSIFKQNAMGLDSIRVAAMALEWKRFGQWLQTLLRLCIPVCLVDIASSIGSSHFVSCF
eukprot:1038678_1